MRAGTLRHRLQLQAPIENSGRFGEVDLKDDNNWKTFATVWGDISPLSGKEAQFAQQTTPEVTHRIAIRGRQPLTAQSRILYKTRKFGIESVLDFDERGIRLMVMAKEVQ